MVKHVMWDCIIADNFSAPKLLSSESLHAKVELRTSVPLKPQSPNLMTFLCKTQSALAAFFIGLPFECCSSQNLPCHLQLKSLAPFSTSLLRETLHRNPGIICYSHEALGRFGFLFEGEIEESIGQQQKLLFLWKC